MTETLLIVEINSSSTLYPLPSISAPPSSPLAALPQPGKCPKTKIAAHCQAFHFTFLQKTLDVCYDCLTNNIFPQKIYPTPIPHFRQDQKKVIEEKEKQEENREKEEDPASLFEDLFEVKRELKLTTESVSLRLRPREATTDLGCLSICDLTLTQWINRDKSAFMRILVGSVVLDALAEGYDPNFMQLLSLLNEEGSMQLVWIPRTL